MEKITDKQLYDELNNYRAEKLLQKLQEQGLITGEKCEELTDRIDVLQEDKQTLLLQDAEDQGLRQRMKEIVEFLKEQEIVVSDYSEDLVRKLIQKITVYDDRCDVEFKSGIIVEVYPPS